MGNPSVAPTPTPKQDQLRASGRHTWFPYYAGFSEDFVDSALSQLPIGSVVLDPWNGSGTTTQVAETLGYRAWGFDLNPVMVVAARARLLSIRTLPSVHALALQIKGMIKRCETSQAGIADPLTQWFSRGAAANLRAIESAIRMLLVGSRPLSEVELADEMSDLAAFFYVALFRAVRYLADSFATSNPTWIKVPRHRRSVLRPSPEIVWRAFSSSLAAMTTSAADPALAHDPRCNKARIAVADSRAMPLEPNSVDLIVTSPPYCTRIDYAVSTRLELAVLRQDASSFDRLRDGLLGTTSISRYVTPMELPARTAALIRSIALHRSKASATYYRQSYEQYFNSLLVSLRDCRRVIRSGGELILIVQDSYYKNLHVDLPMLVSEIASVVGWSHSSSDAFRATRNMAQVNPHVRKYRASVTATEWCLRMRAA